jgi:membrane protease YdiL (CAAX protease family)
MSPEIKSALLRVVPFLIIPLVIAIGIRRKKFTSQQLGITPPSSYIKFFFWWLAFLLFTLLTEVTFYRLGILEVSHWHHDVPSSVIRLLGIIVLAPVAEELIFRGLFLHKLIQWKVNKHAAVLLQALIFVLLHSFTYQNTLSSNIGIAQGFADACIYAYARFNTQSIYTSMAMHSTGNLIAVLEQFIL